MKKKMGRKLSVHSIPHGSKEIHNVLNQVRKGNVIPIFELVNKNTIEYQHDYQEKVVQCG